MGEGYKVILTMWTPILLFIISLLSYLHHSEKLIEERRIEWQRRKSYDSWSEM